MFICKFIALSSRLALDVTVKFVLLLTSNADGSLRGSGGMPIGRITSRSEWEGLGGGERERIMLQGDIPSLLCMKHCMVNGTTSVL